MTSIHAYTDGSFDLKQTYFMNEPCYQSALFAGTPLYAVTCNAPQFAELFRKYPFMAVDYNNPIVASYTLFVPLQGNPVNADADTVRKYLLMHSLDAPMSAALLGRTPAQYVYSRCNKMRILVETTRAGTVLNRTSRILWSEQVGQSIIHYIDRPLGYLNEFAHS